MENVKLKQYDFESAKRAIKSFSNKTPENLELKSVQSHGGLFRLFNHKVTGTELNSVTATIQDYLIDFNKLHIGFIKQFGEVYKALESLDKGYIQSILISIKAAEKASEQAKKAQNDIAATVEVQKETIKELVAFKKRLDNYEHLKNIDRLWSNFEKQEKVVDYTYKKLQESVRVLDTQNQLIKILNQFKKRLEDINHLYEIDKIWGDTKDNKESIKNAINSIESLNAISNEQRSLIDTLLTVKERIESYQHLDDIDVVWDDTQTLISITSQHKDQIETLNAYKNVLENYEHLCQIDEMWNDVEHNKINICSIKTEIEKIQHDICILEQNVAVLNNFQQEIEQYEHLTDIDTIWNDVESGKKDIELAHSHISEMEKSINSINDNIELLNEHKQKVESYEHIDDIDSIWDNVQTAEQDIRDLNDQLLNTANTFKEKNEILQKKLKIAYICIGGSAFISLLQFALTAFGVF